MTKMLSDYHHIRFPLYFATTDNFAEFN